VHCGAIYKIQEEIAMEQANLVIDENGWVRCVKCGEYTGMEGGEPPSTVEAHNDEDEYNLKNPTGYRGGFIIARIWCSACGQCMALVLGNHKGQYYVKMYAAGVREEFPW
jgi:ferredoxin